MAGIAALAAAYILSQFYRSFLAVLTPALVEELGASNADLSAASGAWFIVFASMQFAVGIWLDRHGPRRTAATMFALGAGGGACLFTFAATPWMVVVAMALIGLGCAPILMSSFFIFAKDFSPSRMAVLASGMIGFGMIGNVVGASPLAAAVELFGWRQVMGATTVLSLVVAAVLWLIVRDPADSASDGEHGAVGLGGYLELLRIRALWPIFAILCVNYAAAAGIRGLWAGPYLAQVHEADALLIGQVTLFMAFAMATGSFLYGPLDMVFGTRKWIVVCGSTIGLVALIGLASFPLAGIGTVTVLLVVIGICGGGYGVLVAHGKAFMPERLTGRGVTLLNFCSIGGVGLMQFLTGSVLSAAEVPGDPAAGYRVLFAFYAGMLATCLLIYLQARDAPPRHGGNLRHGPVER